MKNTRTEFKKLVIESIYNLPYKEVIEIEMINDLGLSMIDEDKRKKLYDHTKYVPKITIGRIMQALLNIYKKYKSNTKQIHGAIEMILVEDWKLAKENGQEADDNDQTDETIKKLTTLLK